jgi:hypothetical protein
MPKNLEDQAEIIENDNDDDSSILEESNSK